MWAFAFYAAFFFKTRVFMLMSELVVAVSVCLSVSINVSMYLSDLHNSLKIGLAGYISLKSAIVKLQCEILLSGCLPFLLFSGSKIHCTCSTMEARPLFKGAVEYFRLLSKQKTMVKNIFKPVVNVCFRHQCKLICIEQFNKAHQLPNF